MPRWKALPDELDPQLAEFVDRLRRLVDGGDLSLAALADATGYSRTSWERYLDGRLLAPKGAVVALAEVTGTDPAGLTDQWEAAERAWSGAESRRDMTMEAIRISEAPAAVGGSGHAAAKSGAAAGGRVKGASGASGKAASTPAWVPAQPTAADSPDASAGPAWGAVTVAGGGPASALPSASSPGGPSEGNSWGLAGYRGPAPTGARAARPEPADAPGTRALPAAATPATGHAPVAAGPVPTPAPAPAPGVPTGGRKRTALLVVGLVVAVAAAAGAFLLVNGFGGKEGEEAGPSPSPTVTSAPKLPPGVKCAGALCTGKDAERMGCGGELVTTEASVTVGTALVEVRYSKTCGTAWGRVTGAGQGDEVQVDAGGKRQVGTVEGAGKTGAYTPMVAVKSPGEATACLAPAAGERACT
ncbi:DUF2690 domain-containing protein [Streptomyces sp. NPDC048182]|uniref:XRE family transcriptional regulator n=1 Tax=Streptomyces sp. NPDC048182 TaxID=3365507 RepID=UPI0037225F0D